MGNEAITFWRQDGLRVCHADLYRETGVERQ